MRRSVLLALLLLGPSPAIAELSVQEALLRAKPGVVLVVAEVSTEVTLRCEAARERKTTPPPFRETGTGWFIDAGGWVLTNAHVVSAATEPPPRLRAEQIEKAARAECLPAVLARRGVRPGDRPDLEREAIQQILAMSIPTATVKPEPTITVFLSNGVRF